MNLTTPPALPAHAHTHGSGLADGGEGGRRTHPARRAAAAGSCCSRRPRLPSGAPAHGAGLVSPQKCLNADHPSGQGAPQRGWLRAPRSRPAAPAAPPPPSACGPARRRRSVSERAPGDAAAAADMCGTCADCRPAGRSDGAHLRRLRSALQRLEVLHQLLPLRLRHARHARLRAARADEGPDEHSVDHRDAPAMDHHRKALPLVCTLRGQRTHNHYSTRHHLPRTIIAEDRWHAQASLPCLVDCTL